MNWTTGNLAIGDLKTGENRDVTDEGGWDGRFRWAEHSAWSPDGEQLAYGWYPEDYQERGGELKTISLKGSEARVLYRNEQVEYAQPCSWSGDGKYILAMFHRTDGSHELALVSVADGSVRVVKTAPAEWPHGEASLSPDGRYIVHDLQPRGNAQNKKDIFLLGADGRQGCSIIRPATMPRPGRRTASESYSSATVREATVRRWSRSSMAKRRARPGRSIRILVMFRRWGSP